MKVILEFVLRWIINSFGLYVALKLVGSGQTVPDLLSEPSTLLIAGLLLSAINLFVRPLVAIISLPITVLTLGLFTLVVNGLMVYIALQLTPGLAITFGSAILVGIIVGIVNFIVNLALGAAKIAN